MNTLAILHKLKTIKLAEIDSSFFFSLTILFVIMMILFFIIGNILDASRLLGMAIGSILLTILLRLFE